MGGGTRGVWEQRDNPCNAALVTLTGMIEPHPVTPRTVERLLSTHCGFPSTWAAQAKCGLVLSSLPSSLFVRLKPGWLSLAGVQLQRRCGGPFATEIDVGSAVIPLWDSE
jgi:hypothetical protein